VATSFPNVRRRKDGSSVNAATDNKSIDDLTERTDNLKEQMDGLFFISKRLLLPQEECHSSCQESTVVYWDEAGGKWKPAVAFAEGIENSTKIILQPSSFVQGLIRNIATDGLGNKKGDVYIYGLIDSVSAANLCETGSPVVNVPYYLSLSEEGKVTTVRPLIAEVFVGKFVSLTQFLFTPNINLGSKGNAVHEHVWFPLDKTKFQPDGPDKWLYPAADFPMYPPIPYDSATLYAGGVELYYGEYYTLDSVGMHYEHPAYPPTAAHLSFKMYFTKVTTAASGLVTSICAGTDNLLITEVGTGLPATSGALKLEVIPEIVLESTGNASSLTVKELATDENSGEIKVTKGPVVSALTAGAGISISQSTGPVTISVTETFAEGKEINDIILLNAKSRIAPNSTLTYIEFPSGIESALVAKFLVDADPRPIDIIMYTFGSKDDNNPVQLYIKYKITKIGNSIAGTESSVNKEITVSNLYKRLTLFSLDQSEVEKYSIVSFEMRRKTGDSYPGGLGIFFLRRLDIDTGAP
jgi:hypothetical protein